MTQPRPGRSQRHTRRECECRCELSVAGFDDFPAAHQTLPPLTTIRPPLDEMSRAASEMLIDLINGNRPLELHVRVPVSLVIRQSTGPCREE